MTSLELKLCGITECDELEQLDRLGVDYAGVWYGVPRSPRSRTRGELARLADWPVQHLRRLIVTFDDDPERVAAVGCMPGICGVQLHGFTLPRVLSAIKRRLGERLLFKVLHVQDGVCLEQSLLSQYADCAVDVFIVDSFGSRARPGSTGTVVPLALARALADAVGPERVMLAGGIDATNLPLLRDQALRGVDVDSGARSFGQLDLARIRALVTVTKAEDTCAASSSNGN